MQLELHHKGPHISQSLFRNTFSSINEYWSHSYSKHKKAYIDFKRSVFWQGNNFMYWINHMKIMSISYALFILLKSKIELE